MRNLLPLLLLFLGSCSEPPAPIRLLERDSQLRADWPEGIQARLPEGLTTTKIGGIAPPYAIYEIEMPYGPTGTDSRSALLAPPGSSYELEVQLPPDPVLYVSLGYLVRPESSGAQITFEITIDGLTEERQSVLEERIEFDAEAGWQDRSIALDSWQGETVLLRFETAGGPSWGAWALPEIVSRDVSETAPNVILISLDTLRADHLSSYGYRRKTSPHLDALAERGFRFASAVSQSPWTRPSHKSILQGLFPVSRGGLQSPALGEVLWKAGHRTGAFTGGGQVDRSFGFMDGFESYRVHDWLRKPQEVINWLQVSGGRPNFLFLHTYEIHDPYIHRQFAEGMPSGELPETFTKHMWNARRKEGLSADERLYVEALYDSGIAFTDDRLGHFIKLLEETDLLQRTAIIVTSDHGEQFWEHGSWRHGSTMYDHQLMVPLIVYLPPRWRAKLGEVEGGVIDRQVSLVDLYPTILDLFDVALDHDVHGRSLLPLLAGTDLPPRRSFSENTNVRKWERKAVRSELYKFIYSYRRGAKEADSYMELYDLRRDPGEQENLAQGLPETVSRLLEEIERLRQQGETLEEEVPDDISPKLRSELEALGYIGE